MKKNFQFFLSVIFLFSLGSQAKAGLCKKEFQLSIKMDDEWYKKEEARLANEEILLQKHADHISKKTKPLIAERYQCERGEKCDPIKNCQMEKNIKDLFEVEYEMKLDSGIIIAKSYCSVIGKCIGYNDFSHSLEVTAAEDRLVNIKKDNAVFYHYFYSAKTKNYEPLFNITNFHSGSELYLNDIPHFSPDEKVIVEVRSIAKQETGNFPSGFNINIYELNDKNEYVNIEPAELDPEDSSKVISTFLSRHPECGETPHFNSWKKDGEVRLSMLPPSAANLGRKVILAYDKKAKKWGCKEDLFPEVRCESYLPSSTKFSSNLAMEQINDCR